MCCHNTWIDLVLDLISGKQTDNKEKYFTFFYFDNLNKKEGLNEIWKKIQHTFLILKDWYEDHELYHKIGYLIASKSKSLQDILVLSRRVIDGRGITKNQFKSELDEYIKKSITINRNYSRLSYETHRDYTKIGRLLLLFNVESVRQNGEQTQWFPFEKFKFQRSGQVAWSLEHIHAQQSEGMKKKEDWKEWLRLHLSSIVCLGNDNDELAAESEKKEDDEAESWVRRKKSTIEYLKDYATEEEKIIALGDKLSNIRAMYRDRETIGDKLWERFNQKDKYQHGWYYQSVGEALASLSKHPAYREYCNLVEQVFYGK